MRRCCVVSEVRVRLSKKNTLYIPKSIAEAVGIREGSVLRLRVEGCRIIIEPIPDAVELSLRGEKVARVSLEELEAESVERQEGIIGEA
ncbi:MAG: AbrB/MazE/SpoVT family DNA-binding domain-containing protein [Thermoprotei archaeon]|nr:MAG: AbrB/MazE/SpoVT family DNA-binding domain-containing protein [Thermoprotei archaeon]